MKSSLDRKFLLSNREFIKSREYWMQRLASIAGNENARLPFARPAGSPANRGSLDTELDPETARNLLLVCKNNDQAIYIYLLTCLKILLYKYTGRRNVTVGMPAAATGLTGGAAFGGLLPVHNYLDGTGTFRSLLMQVKASVYEALPHQHYPVDDLLPELNVTDGLFDAVLLSHALHGTSTAGQPLVITLRTSPATGRVELNVAYRAGMHAWAKEFAGSFGHVVAACLRDPSVPIHEINTWHAGETADTDATTPARDGDRFARPAGEGAPDAHADLAEQRRFWLGQFDPLPEVLRLPADFKRLPAGNQAGATVGFALDADRTGRLRQLAEKEGTGLFTVLLAAYYVLLNKLSGQDDIVVGTPLAHRPATNPADPFANPLPLRNHPQPHLTFKEFLASVKSRTRACFDHPHYPAQTLMQELHPEANGSRTPLFNAGFVYAPGEDAGPVPSDCTPVADGVDLTLYATGTGNGLELGFAYSPALFGADTVQRWAAYLQELVDTVTANPTQLLNDVVILPAAEQHRLLHAFNDTRMAYNAAETVLSLFKQQVARTPDLVAVQDGTQRLTFAQLNRGADALAREIGQLIAPGEKPKIGLLFHPSVEMVVGMLAVLKAGGAYVPLSPEGSPQRNQYMLADCGARVLLVQQDLWLDHPTVALFEDMGEVLPVSAGDVPDAVPAPDPGTTSEDSLYVIYTSGTTGSPKGVEVKNAGIVNLLHFYRHLFQVEAGTRISQVANIGFDAAACEIWPSLVHGGCLIIAPPDKRPDADKMQKWLIANRIEVSFQPTAIAEYLLRAPWKTGAGALRVMSVAGDRLNYVPAAPLPFALYNLYGPSEDSVWTTWTKLACTGVPGPYSIGKPIANKKVFIVNKNNQLQPLGVPGELCIAGAGLSKGYLNNERLTKEKFVACPFVPGAQMYKTGDQARWLPTGEIEFLGRSDDQVKIRGFRIEPGEIETQLATLGAVTETVVLAREKDGEKFLVAYYVAARPIEPARLRAYLGERLPDYMVPAHFVHLPRLPLTPNGKVNKKALPDPALAKGSSAVAPANPLEKQLVAVWEDILDRSGIGVTDNFFELGGHSLKAAQLIAWLYDDLGVTVELRQVFAAPTIRQLAQMVADQKPAQQREITPIATQAYYPISHAQKRMWVLDQLEKGRIADNMPNAYELIGPLDRLPLEKAFDTLIERHEMLRTAFATVAGAPVQRVNDHAPGRFTLDYRDLRGETEPVEVARQLAAQEANTPFALKEGPLLRVRLLQLAAERHVLLLTLHHIAADGWSMDILTREVLALYAAYRAGGENPLAPLPLQYKDFAAWQQEELLGSKMKQDAAFWLEQLREPLPVVSVKPDFPAGRQSPRGEVLPFALTPEVCRQLKELREAHRVTSFSVVLAAFNLLLHHVTGHEDIVVGAPVSGRTHKSFEGQIGNFLNTIVIRTRLNANTPFAELLADVSRTYIDAFEHQNYPFDLVVEDLNLKRNAGRAGLFDIGFTWMAANGGPAGPSPGFSIDDFDAGVVPVKADLWLHGRENEGRISLFFVYRAELYKKETIQLLVERFLKLMDQATARPATRAGEFDLKLAVEHALDNAKVSLGLDF